MASLTMAYYFKYMGRVLSALENDWPAVVTKLRKAQKKWVRLLRVLGREGADDRTLGTFYMVVVQVVLIFVSETWVMYPCIMLNIVSI